MDFPLVELLQRSGWVARIVVILLALFSFVSWAIIFNRFYVMGGINKANKKFRRKYSVLGKISDIEDVEDAALKSPMGQLGKAGSQEYKRILEDAQSHGGVKDWSFFLQSQFSMSAERIEGVFIGLNAPFTSGLIFLAMTSSVAPFLGLFGTVWGIMTAFLDIGNQGSASLPVVAPGIAEALITTAISLAVAIPALFFYNYFNHQAEKIEDEMYEFKELLLARLKREIITLLYAERPRTTPNSGTRTV